MALRTSGFLKSVFFQGEKIYVFIFLMWCLLFFSKEKSMQQTYKDLCSEVTHLQSELRRQTGLIRKLKPLINEARQGEAAAPQKLCPLRSVSVSVCFFFNLTFVSVWSLSSFASGSSLQSWEFLTDYNKYVYVHTGYHEDGVQSWNCCSGSKNNW